MSFLMTASMHHLSKATLLRIQSPPAKMIICCLATTQRSSWDHSSSTSSTINSGKQIPSSLLLCHHFHNSTFRTDDMQAWYSTSPMTESSATTTTGGGGDDSSKKDRLFVGDIVDRVSVLHGLSKVESNKIIDTILDTIANGLRDEKDIMLTRFGTFSTYRSKETKGRNPKTGDVLLIPAKTRIRFHASNEFKSCVEEKKLYKVRSTRTPKPTTTTTARPEN